MDGVPERIEDGEASGKKFVRERLKREGACQGAIQKHRRDVRTHASRRQERPASAFYVWKTPGSSWRWPEDARPSMEKVLENDIAEGFVKDSSLGAQSPPTYDIPRS